MTNVANDGSDSSTSGLIFRQLFEPLSSTYTYLLACRETGEAALIDPVYPTWERDACVLSDLGLRLSFTLETHVHADHITAALRLRKELGSRAAFPDVDRLPCADIPIEDGVPLNVGRVAIEPIFTPGHTDDHYSFRCGDRLFTGDALLIDGCGRTDFQNGDATTLYHSVHDRLFCFPDDFLVYPGHDYNDRRVSTVAQEKRRNARLGGGRSLADFVALMASLNLPYPKFIDFAVPGNRRCGVCPDDLPDRLQEYCDKMSFSPQG